MRSDDGSGRYRLRQAVSAEDIDRAQRFRARIFGLPVAQDRDRFDAVSRHVLIERAVDGQLACCFRMRALNGERLDHSYTAQFYDLSALAGFPDRMLEVGRFCIDPSCRDPDVLRRAWAVIAAHVDAEAIGLLFGCASFTGTETQTYLDAFAMLRARHLGPERWRPGVKAPDVFCFDADPRQRSDDRRAMRSMPPLLRAYLRMGGWVSDHAVVDRKMNTLHVFTGLAVAEIPPARRRLLRALV